MFIFSTDAYQDFTKKLVKQARLKYGRLTIKKFADGEIYVKVKEKVAGQNVFVVGTTAPPSDNLVEFLLLCQALTLAKVKSITAVLPYLGYERADRLKEAGEAVSAKLVADLLKFSQVKKIIALDLHSQRVVNFIKEDIKLVHLSAIEILAAAIKRENLKKIIVVAPDNGALTGAKKLAKFLSCGVAWMEKFRPRHNVACVRKLYGDVQGKQAVIFDDMIDTAGTICQAVCCLREAGAKKILVAATHGIFSGPAIGRLRQAPISIVFVTDSVLISQKKRIKKIRIVPVTSLLSKNL
ncbi:MAG: ribose-phosphate pyrophosphokinase [bacterium]|nr:ribose-phosphate pyrophosphokinase [bacterium]